MRQTISITIEHRVVASNRSYEQVKESLEARLGVAGNIDELVRQLAVANASWEQVTQAIEKRLGTSGFTIFSKVDHGTLLSLAGKPRRSLASCSQSQSRRNPRKASRGFSPRPFRRQAKAGEEFGIQKTRDLGNVSRSPLNGQHLQGESSIRPPVPGAAQRWRTRLTGSMSPMHSYL